ncbi:MAG: type III pantothenate kinase [Planctomycetota bacterium]|nr:type III pantothenate kinase [Planctomycetota bacterium]
MKRGQDLAFVDIGNTSAKVAVVSETKLIVESYVYQNTDWHQSVSQFPKEITGSTPEQWLIASVNQERANTLEVAIESKQDDPVIHRIRHQDVPLSTTVDHPDQLGIDRLLSGFMASTLFDPPLIVVSFGTAVTIDWIDSEGNFAGGSILPGIQLQSESLALRTERLPEVKWTKSGPISLPGKNTSDAIRSGVILGLASAIDGMITLYAEQNSIARGKIQTLITGGDAGLVTPYLRSPHLPQSNLVCHALLELSKRKP